MKKLLLMACAVAGLFTAYGQGYPTSGLVAYYPMDGYSQGSDSSGHGYHGQLNNTNPTDGHTGWYNQATEFNGLNSMLSYNFTNSMAAFQNQEFTVATWIKINDMPNSYLNIFEIGDRSYLRFRRQAPDIWVIQSGYKYEVEGMTNYNAKDYSNTEELYSSNSYKDKWVHIVFTTGFGETGRMNKLYINGEYKDGGFITQNVSIPYSPQDTLLQIGARLGTSVLSLDGSLQDYFYYNRMLDTSEIGMLYRMCKSTTTNITHFKCSGDGYPFNGQVIYDAGEYAATYPSVYGCDSIVKLFIINKEQNIEVTVQDSVCTATAIDGASYTWYMCNGEVPLNNDNSNVLVATEPGSYSCQVLYNGCYSVSNCVEVVEQPVETGISEANKLNVSVYPNPNSGLFTINNNSGKQLTAKLINSLGATVQLINVVEGSQQINMAYLPSGMYQLLLSNEANNIQQVQRLVKQ